MLLSMSYLGGVQQARSNTLCCPVVQFGTARRTDAPPYLDPYDLMVEEAVSA